MGVGSGCLFEFSPEDTTMTTTTGQVPLTAQLNASSLVIVFIVC